MPNIGRAIGIAAISALTVGAFGVAAGYSASAAPQYTCVTAGGAQYRTGPGLRYPTIGLSDRGQQFTKSDTVVDSKEQITWAGGTRQGAGPEVWLDAGYLGGC